MLRTGLLACAALLFVAAAPTEQQTEAEKQKLVGTFDLKGFEDDGRIIDSDQVRFKAVITRKTITIEANARERESEYRVDPTKKPKTIDLIWKDKDGKERVTLGIYHLDGDKLKICLALEGSKKRPTGDISSPDFETKRGSKWQFYRLYRAKR